MTEIKVPLASPIEYQDDNTAEPTQAQLRLQAVYERQGMHAVPKIRDYATYLDIALHPEKNAALQNPYPAEDIRTLSKYVMPSKWVMSNEDADALRTIVDPAIASMADIPDTINDETYENVSNQYAMFYGGFSGLAHSGDLNNDRVYAFEMFQEEARQKLALHEAITTASFVAARDESGAIDLNARSVHESNEFMIDALFATAGLERDYYLPQTAQTGTDGLKDFRITKQVVTSSVNPSASEAPFFVPSTQATSLVIAADKLPVALVSPTVGVPENEKAQPQPATEVLHRRKMARAAAAIGGLFMAAVIGSGSKLKSSRNKLRDYLKDTRPSSPYATTREADQAARAQLSQFVPFIPFKPTERTINNKGGRSEALMDNRQRIIAAAGFTVLAALVGIGVADSFGSDSSADGGQRDKTTVVYPGQSGQGADRPIGKAHKPVAKTESSTATHPKAEKTKYIMRDSKGNLTKAYKEAAGFKATADVEKTHTIYGKAADLYYNHGFRMTYESVPELSNAILKFNNMTPADAYGLKVGKLVKVPPINSSSRS